MKHIVDLNVAWQHQQEQHWVDQGLNNEWADVASRQFPRLSPDRDESGGEQYLLSRRVGGCWDPVLMTFLGRVTEEVRLLWAYSIQGSCSLHVDWLEDAKQQRAASSS